MLTLGSTPPPFWKKFTFDFFFWTLPLQFLFKARVLNILVNNLLGNILYSLVNISLWICLIQEQLLYAVCSIFQEIHMYAVYCIIQWILQWTVYYIFQEIFLLALWCIVYYIILNNWILKSNSLIFRRSEGFITQYTP